MEASGQTARTGCDCLDYPVVTIGIFVAPPAGALSSAFPGAIPGQRNCKVRMRRSKTLWYVLITLKAVVMATAVAGKR